MKRQIDREAPWRAFCLACVIIVESARCVPVTLKIDPLAYLVGSDEAIVSRGGGGEQKHTPSWCCVKTWCQDPAQRPRDVYIIKERSSGRNGPSSWNSFCSSFRRRKPNASLSRRKGAESAAGASRCLSLIFLFQPDQVRCRDVFEIFFSISSRREFHCERAQCRSRRRRPERSSRGRRPQRMIYLSVVLFLC